MRNITLIILLLFCFSGNAQDIIIGENINNGVTVNQITGDDLCNDNSIRVEIDFKNSNAKIINFGELRNYEINRVCFLGDGYFEIYCSSNMYQDIRIYVTTFNISIVYNDSLMAFAQI